jgi:hypothetical protein
MRKLFTSILFLVAIAGFSLRWKDCLPKEIPINSVVSLPPPYKNTEHIRLLAHVQRPPAPPSEEWEA